MELSEEKIQEVLEKLSILKRFVDTHKIDRLIARFSKTRDMETQVFLFSRIYAELQKLEKNFPGIDASFPLVNIKKEGLEIGSLLHKEQVISRMFLSIDDLNRNILIIGSTGHGKTSLIRKIVEEAGKYGINYLIFDMKKDYISLGLDRDSIYMDSDDLKINPLEAPKGINEKQWAVHFADIFSDSFALLIGSRDYLLEQTIGLFSSWNKTYPPRLSDLLFYITVNGRKNDYYRVIEGRLKSLVSSSSLFDCNCGIPFENLEDKNIIIGLENVGIAEQHFIVAHLLSLLYYSNLDFIKTGKFKRLIVIDDAHSVLDANQEKDYAKGIPILHSIIAKIRESGFGFIFSDQQLSSVLSSAIQNTNTKFIGRINLYPDLHRILPDSYKITDEMANLGKGEFILFNEAVSPFCVFKADKSVSSAVFDKSLFEVKRRSDRSMFKFFRAGDMSFNDVEFLKEISSNPYFNIRMHKENLSKFLDADEFNSIKKRLLQNKVISEISINVQGDKTSKFLFINREAENEMGDEIAGLSLFDERSFLKYILKYFVGNYLRSRGIKYEADEGGFLIKGLIKLYILLDQDIAGLARILETSFDKVIFVAGDSVREEEVLSELIKTGDAKSMLNLKNLRIVHLNEFRL